MAELPVETQGITAPATFESETLFPGSQMLSGFARLPMVRQTGLLVMLAATVAIGFSIVLWMKEPNYRMLAGVVTPHQVNEVTQLLQNKSIPYKLDEASGTLLVPADRIHEARMEVAGSNIVPGEQSGYELLDAEQGFGVSQFMETTRYRRSQEGELARSVMSINAVRKARVHLAIPKNTIFLRDERKPTASVSVTLVPGRQLSADQVNAIMNLVAGAVSSMSAKDVTVIDQNGHLLSDDIQQDEFQKSGRQLDYVQKLERNLQRKIRNILAPMVGVNRFTAEVSADIDFTRLEQTQELYNPDLAALRSEQIMEEKRIGGETAGGIPGALSNQPPGAVTIPETQDNTLAGIAQKSLPSKSKTQSTRNFELDRTISHTRHQVGELQRVTVSVVVDDIPVYDAEADTTSYVPWKENDLERLTALVKNAIGYDSSRGDMVSVLNSPFVEERTEPAVEAPIWTQTWFLELVKLALGGLGLLILVLGLLRPLFKSLSANTNENPATEAALAEIRRLKEDKATHDAQLLQVEMARSTPVVTSSVLPAIKEPDYQRNLETVKTLVAENPARVAQVVQHWITSDE